MAVFIHPTADVSDAGSARAMACASGIKHRVREDAVVGQEHPDRQGRLSSMPVFTSERAARSKMASTCIMASPSKMACFLGHAPPPPTI
jgi:hypothetical protein